MSSQAVHRMRSRSSSRRERHCPRPGPIERSSLPAPPHQQWRSPPSSYTASLPFGALATKSPHWRRVHQPFRGRRGGKKQRKRLGGRRGAVSTAARAARPPRPPRQQAIRHEVPAPTGVAAGAPTGWRRVIGGTFRRHLALVVVLFGLGGALCGSAAAMLTTALAPADYTASADTRLIVEGEPGHPDAGVESAFRQAEVLADLAVGPGQLDVIGQTLDPPATGAELAGVVTARRQPGLLIITFSARDGDPARAAAIANAAAESLVAATSRDSLARIRMELSGSAVVPDHPSHRYLPRDLAIGAIGGAVLAVAAVLMVRQRRRQAPEEEKRRSVDRWAIAIGAVLGLAIVVGIALRLPDNVVQTVAALALVVAALSPGAGLATLAVTIPMREPPGFVPVGYPALLIAATAYGLLLTLAASRARPRVTVLGVLAIGYLAISAVSIVP